MHLIYLFSPGDSRKKMEKALAGDCAVLIDLEDGVASSQKNVARDVVRATLEVSGSKSFLAVRCNAVNTLHFSEDIALLKTLPIHAVMIPKCERAADIEAVAEALPEVDIIPLIESAAGVYNLDKFAAACSRIKRVAFGSVDFALDLGVDWTADGEERRHAMGHLVLTSRAIGLEPPIDAVFPVLDDKEAFQKDARYGRDLGFFGKMIIHPRQGDWLREVYRVSEDEAAWAKRVVELYERDASSGALELDGKLVDLPVYLRAKRVLTMIS